MCTGKQGYGATSVGLCGSDKYLIKHAEHFAINILSTAQGTFALQANMLLRQEVVLCVWNWLCFLLALCISSRACGRVANCDIVMYFL